MGGPPKFKKPRGSLGVSMFYATKGGKTEELAGKIKQNIGDACSSPKCIADADLNDLQAYKLLALGVPSYLGADGSVSSLEFDGITKLFEGAQDALRGTKVALFGIGDQTGYPDNFVDGLKGVWDKLRAQSAFSTAGMALLDRRVEVDFFPTRSAFPKSI